MRISWKTIVLLGLLAIATDFAIGLALGTGPFRKRPSSEKFEEPKPTPDWNIPVAGRERELYELSHSLVLPSAVERPVPFDFGEARTLHAQGGKSVEQQYFEHLCGTESRDYIFKPIDSVDGFQFVRPRGDVRDTPADADRFGVEEPVGFGWMGDDSQLDDDKIGLDMLAEGYVQPLYGIYQFVELEDPARNYQLVRVWRDAKNPKNERAPHGRASWRGLRVPVAQGRRVVNDRLSKYGMTRRGPWWRMSRRVHIQPERS